MAEKLTLHQRSTALSCAVNVISPPVVSESAARNDAVNEARGGLGLDDFLGENGVKSEQYRNGH